MIRRGLVVPADPDQPLSTIEWEHNGELLPLLAGTIGCEMVAAVEILLDGADLTMRVDAMSTWHPAPAPNPRMRRFLAALAHPVAEHVNGTVVLIGGITGKSWDGLPDELLHDLQRELTRTDP